MKVNVTVSIDKDVYETSHRLGVNVSKICENYLKMLNATIEGTNSKTGFLTPGSFTKETGVAGGVGFEPTTPNLGGQSWQGTAEDWNRFRGWIQAKKYRGGYETTLFNYAQLYSDCLFTRDLSKISDLSVSKRPNILKALSSLAKFCGCYEDWKTLLKNYGLSWVGRSGSDIFIDRLTNCESPDEIWSWIKFVKEARPELTDLLDLMAVTGLRFVEGVNSFNLIIQLNREDKLASYWKPENAALEHFRFKEVFIRNTKKAFVSFVPENLVNNICDSRALSSASVKKLVQKRELPLRFGDIREAQGTLMTKFLKESEINFLHGRVTSSVFMSNYFNPSLIVDLKVRVFQGISEIQEKVKL